MEDRGDSKNNSIKDIFQTMDYGDDSESLTEAIEWLKTKENSIFAYVDKKDESPNGETILIKNTHNGEDLGKVYVPEESTIEKILTKVGGAKNEWQETIPSKKSEILYKLGAELQKKQKLFTQLEITVRGILSKDVKNKTLPLLTDYLQYYSRFAVKYNKENPTWKPEGMVVCILPKENPLWVLGLVLGPCLALGYHIILQPDPELSSIAALFIDIAHQVGIPEGTIRLIPGNINPNVFLIHSKVSHIAIFDDLYKEKYLIANHFNKKILNFSSIGSPMIVFDDCDLDSACHGVIDAAWNHTGMLPWSIKTILIQENIFNNFTQKLKNKLDQIKCGSADEKNLDIAKPNSRILEKLDKIVSKVRNDGVEVYQSNNNNFPAILIGCNIFPNNVIKTNDLDVPLVTLTPFRTINEALTLSNNTRQGLGVSIWTESTSLIHEILSKLKVGNVWINSFGLFSADVGTSPYRTSGNCYLGGAEGFYEYTNKISKNESGSQSQTQSKEAMENAISDAKKAQDGWFKTDRFNRMKLLQIIGQNINNNKNELKLDEQWWDDWYNSIYDYNEIDENFIKKKNFNILQSREPYGIVAIETSNDKGTHNKKLIIAALAEGNSVIVLNDSKDLNAFYSLFTQTLPKGVFTVVPQSPEATKVAALHKELSIYVGEYPNKVFSSLPLQTSVKFKTTNQNNWREIQNTITLVKNVWFNKGQSFT